MGYVYRYRDTVDGIIKYVGIVWCDTSIYSLKRRIYQHKLDPKFDGVDWKIEYLCEGIKSRTDAEYLESHYISLYHTDLYLNISKKGWGVSSFIPDKENEWKEYSEENTQSESQKAVDIDASDFFDILLNCQDDETKKRIYMSATKRISSAYGNAYWERFKSSLDECLNKKLFGESNGIARFNGFGRILIELPIMGTIKLEKGDSHLSIRGKKYNIDNFESLTILDLKTIKDCIQKVEVQFG